MQLETLEQRCAALQRRHGKRRERLAGRAARIRKEQRSQAAAGAKGRAAGGANASTPSRQHEGAGAMGPPAGTPAKGTPVRAVSEVDVGGEGAEVERADSIAGMRKLIEGWSLEDSGQFKRFNGETVAF